MHFVYPIKKDKIFFSNETIQFLCGFSADCPSSEELQTNVYAARLHANCARESESQRFRSDWLVFFFFLFEKKMCLQDRTPPFCELMSTEGSEKVTEWQSYVI